MAETAPGRRRFLRLTFAECYSVAETDAPNWLRVPRTFGRQLGRSPMLNVLKAIGLSTRLGTARFAATPAGLLIKWKPGQHRFVPWSELGPLLELRSEDLFEPGSLFPAKGLVKHRKIVRFSMQKCPDQEILLAQAPAFRLVTASGGRWRQIA